MVELVGGGSVFTKKGFLSLPKNNVALEFNRTQKLTKDDRKADEDDIKKSSLLHYTPKKITVDWIIQHLTSLHSTLPI